MEKFLYRHLGPGPKEEKAMLQKIGMKDIEEMIFNAVPDDIRYEGQLQLPPPMSESEYLDYLRTIANANSIYRSFIGQGYYRTFLPPVLQRNILENPGWYTSYTPYQAEISQGRLEALLNFQTMVCELTALPLANSSLLDEATAAAEAMWMMYETFNKKRKKQPATVLFVDKNIFEHTKPVLELRASARNIEIEYGDFDRFVPGDRYFGVIVQYPGANGEVKDFRAKIEEVKSNNIPVTFIADLMSLVLLTPPGEMGADIAVGTTQRFGTPMAFGGPHAAYLAAKEEYKRRIPGRIIGVSVDKHGNLAYRMALQTREQHIKREKATSNICTAQALLAIIAGFYAIYHGKDGLGMIAKDIYRKTSLLATALQKMGLQRENKTFFDTLTFAISGDKAEKIKELALKNKINFFYHNGKVSISIDELTEEKDLDDIIKIFAGAFDLNALTVKELENSTLESGMEPALRRTSPYLKHEIFSRYRSETELMRYIKRLENKDLSLVHSMIPLGSCTMKLNAAVEMLPVTWRKFTDIHPFVPQEQAQGYLKLIDELGQYLQEITGFDACTFQPNSGAQGEFTGLMTIRAYHRDRGDIQRNVVLVPSSAHGTNPASAVMAGMKVVIVKCDEHGNIDVQDLEDKASEYKDSLAAFMVTYPSTHGVFEKEIVKMCDIIHQNGGLVYMDGANMNAQIGITKPSIIGADICHLNLHKTFAIPHGGGGPGVGPVLANKKLAPYLPTHIYLNEHREKAIKAVASAPYGSAGILMISHAYIRLMGAEGLRKATEIAILNANYLKTILGRKYNIVYTNSKGMVAHEMILDIRPYKEYGITAEDVAKRLMDYGFHAPTVSFPVHDTLMIEPTESESKEELDRFCEAMLSIRYEIEEIAHGKYDTSDNVLKNAPHTAWEIAGDDWDKSYSRSKAAYPLYYLKTRFKYWAPVSRIDNAFGDRNLYCTCPPVEDYDDFLIKPNL